MYRTVFWTLWEKARVGCFKRTVSKHVYYLGWNRSPAQVGCMRQALGPGALGRRRGIGWRGRWEGGLGWGTHVNPWLIHFNVWENPLQLKKKKKSKQIIHLSFTKDNILLTTYLAFSLLICLGGGTSSVHRAHVKQWPCVPHTRGQWGLGDCPPNPVKYRKCFNVECVCYHLFQARKRYGKARLTRNCQ